MSARPANKTPIALRSEDPGVKPAAKIGWGKMHIAAFIISALIILGVCAAIVFVVVYGLRLMVKSGKGKQDDQG